MDGGQLEGLGDTLAGGGVVRFTSNPTVKPIAAATGSVAPMLVHVAESSAIQLIGSSVPQC